MTVVQPAAPHPADRAAADDVEEPSRFAAYAQGCAPAPVGVIDRLLAGVERLLVPDLSRTSRRRGRPARPRG